MESLTIYVKKSEQIDILYQFLQHLDFVIMPTEIKKKPTFKRKEYSIFNSAGIWKDRDITQDNLRAIAWKKA